MADIRHNLVVDTSQSQMSLRQMRQEMKNLQIEMGKTTDPTRFKQLEKQFAILRNDVGDTSKAMKYLDPGELLGGWIKMAQGAVGAFAAVTGAMSLFGVENENLQAIEKKSMTLIQTMMGLEQARQLLIDGGGKAEQKTILKSTIAWLGKTLGITKNTAATATNTTATVAQTTATGAQTVATGGATLATRLLGVAMKALPIFAIIGGIAAIVSVVSNLISANREAAQAQAELNEAGNKYKETSAGLKDSVEDYIDSVKKSKLDHKLAMGEMTQNEYDHAISSQKALDSLDEVRLKYTKAEGASRAIANKEKEIEEKRFIAQIDRLKRTDFTNEQDRQDAINKAYTQHNEKLAQINTNHLARIFKDKKEYDKAYDASQEKRRDEDEESDKKELERKKKLWQEYLNELKRWQNRVEDYKISLIEDELNREQAQTEIRRARELKELEESKLTATQKAKFKIDIEKYYDKQLEDIEKKRADKRAEAFIQELKNEQAQLEAAQKSDADVQKRLDDINEFIKIQKELQRETKKSTFLREIEGQSWEDIQDKMWDYYDQLILSEEDVNEVIRKFAKKDLDANQEAYNKNIISFTEAEQNKTEIAKAENEKRIADIQNYSAAYQDILSSANSLISALGERELIGVEANSKKGLEIRKKQAKQQLAMQIAMSAGLIAAGVLQAIAETGVAAPVVAAGLISLGATQVAAIIKAQNAIDQIDVEIANLADGGYVMGKGGPRSDSIPANLSNGEFVLNAAAVDRLGLNLVNTLNKGNSSSALIDYDLLAEKINEKQVYVTDRAITNRQYTTKVTEKRTRL